MIANIECYSRANMQPQTAHSFSLEISFLICMSSSTPCFSHTQFPTLPPLCLSPKGCYGPCLNQSGIQDVHTAHSDWLPAMQGWAHEKRRKGRRKKRLQFCLLDGWLR
ncbi:hypothetical protein AMECASPLE_009744 [Ameca splendens]|uniref:Uncharacterized protein n=1 Tax=Ameca splendens TaxID=208324 RepID=A0ABV1A6L7_9TELE